MLQEGKALDLVVYMYNRSYLSTYISWYLWATLHMGLDTCILCKKYEFQMK